MTRVQVLPDEGRWKIAIDGDDRGERFETQGVAEQEGRRIAREMNAEFVLHAGSGRIRQKDSYGHDPRNIKG